MQKNAMQALRSLDVDGVQSLTIPAEPFFPNLMEQLEPIWNARPAILSFHFGLPPIGVIEKAHALGIAVGISATSLEEALAIESAHADFIVAQGIEAGGHRGQFDLQAKDEALSTLALTAQLAKHCHTPIVAAGGIMQHLLTVRRQHSSEPHFYVAMSRGPRPVTATIYCTNKIGQRR
jgi:nitronate monooxygenase